jgi:hypothetical protein
MVLAILVVVFLPTWFFIIGEFHTTYAAATAAMAILLTGRGPSLRDGAILCGLGALCLASYEAMIYLGPFLAAATLWSMVRGRHSAEQSTDGVARLLGWVAALAFLAGAVVATGAVIEYWDHAYFTRVRHATFDFWQDLQFIVPLTGLGVLSVVSIIWPSWLKGRAPLVAVGVVAAVLVSTIWFRQILNPEAMLFPPAHYVARTGAGGVLLVFLAAMWLHVAWRAPPRLLGILRQPQVGHRLVTAMFVLVLAATVPDLALTRLWVGYLDYFRGAVTSQAGLVSSSGLPLAEWPYRLFAQDWTYPALSVLVRSAPGQGIIVAPKDYRSFPPFEPSCGTVPRLEGFRWRNWASPLGSKNNSASTGYGAVS